MSLIPTISRPAPADGLEMSQSWTVVPDACRIATPKLSPVTVIASSRTVTFEAVTSTVPCTSNPANTVPAPEISTPPLDQDQPGPLDTWLGTERSDATWGPVLVASGKPHACGLAAQSVCPVTGPVWEAGGALDAGSALPVEPLAWGSPPPARTTPGWAQGRVKPTGFWSPAGLDGVPYEAMRIGKPVAYASSIMPCPITIATCPGFAAVPSDPAKKTRSPGCSWPGATLGPQVHCSAAVR